jgi:hypothetical protein
MPVHDWSRVFAGAFHDFHHVWIGEFRNALNSGILPPDFYAMAEQVARPTVPDVLTLQEANGIDGEGTGEGISGATAVATAPPRVRQSESIEEETYARRQRSIVIHHNSDDRIIALIEIVSDSNKSSKKEFQSFVTKATDLLDRGYHLMLIDLQPRTSRDREGIHTVICAEFGHIPHPTPADKPMTLIAYDAGPPVKIAYVEPVAVGDKLIDMSLLLATGWYVSVPLETTYQAAWRGVPRRFRDVLEPPKG